MLTSEVKQRINSCRDILVGKLPDPKSQVLQITNALIYKFMDDQDRQAEKLGGKPSFFVKELKPYAWHKLFDSKLTNQERADLYIEGVQKLSEAKHLPELFQEIFKEAYVPFRAAQTITLFISEINKFDYTHSEELGNAYEYLLSIMGSQGDAGQFRTPRHIIEFMVDVVDPKKGETIYDPACGTAGFLIAAYNHILEANGGKLKATERNTLAHNISGVDISPDMAKMARVNLYLHGFSTPVIDEGDTLSDEELWGKKHDVVLANPPFMSPKGGIIPHDLFGIKAKRAEVLFVDYIAEHLKLKGRAAIVVPEGIIFQSGTTYKALRKMLVENGYLHSVISLPAGVFQPYSGVKTSILILDREKAKESSEVLFLKIEKDGYSQSTQRTKLCDDNGDNPEWCEKHSDLPQALKIAKEWQKGKKKESTISSWVSKEEIAASGDYSLTGDRYQIFDSGVTSWSLVKLGDVVEVLDRLRKPITKKDRVEGQYPYYGATGILDHVNDFIFDERLVLVGEDGAKWSAGEKTAFIAEGKYWVNNHAHVLRPVEGRLMDTFLVSILNYLDLNRYITGVTVPKLNQEKLRSIEIPLPPLEVQQEIVTELNRYQKIIDGAHQVVENYKPSFKIEPDWDLVKFGDEDVIKIIDGDRGQHYPKKSEFKDQGYCLFLNTSNVRSGNFDFKKCDFIAKERDQLLRKGKLVRGDVVLTTRGTLGNTAYFSDDIEYENIRINSGMVILRAETKHLNPAYLLEFLNSVNFTQQMNSMLSGSAQPQLPIRTIVQMDLPLPSLKIQKEIVKSLNKEKGFVKSTKEIIPLFEQKIQDKISELWGE